MGLDSRMTSIHRLRVRGTALHHPKEVCFGLMPLMRLTPESTQILWQLNILEMKMFMYM